MCGSPSVNSVMPCSPRVTSSASRSRSARSLPPLAQELGLRRAAADHGLELAAVRRERERAAVALEVRALRIDEHRDVRGTALRDELRRAAQRAFGVVREHDDVRATSRASRNAAPSSGAAGSSDCSASSRISCWLRASTRSLCTVGSDGERTSSQRTPRCTSSASSNLPRVVRRRRCRPESSARRARPCSARRSPRRPRAARRSASARPAPAPRARSAPCRRTNTRRASRRRRRARERARSRESVNVTTASGSGPALTPFYSVAVGSAPHRKKGPPRFVRGGPTADQ